VAGWFAKRQTWRSRNKRQWVERTEKLWFLTLGTPQDRPVKGKRNFADIITYRIGNTTCMAGNGGGRKAIMADVIVYDKKNPAKGGVLEWFFCIVRAPDKSILM
jgi:hypothetical protein